jgi:hypothetical protein
MRFFCYNEPGSPKEGSILREVSDNQIRKNYYPEWLVLMEKKFGKEYVAENYCFEDCLEDWCTIHWAWESTDEEEEEDSWGPNED